MKFKKYLKITEETSPEVAVLTKQNQALRAQEEVSDDPEKKREIRLEIAKNNVKLAELRQKEGQASKKKEVDYRNDRGESPPKKLTGKGEREQK